MHARRCYDFFGGLGTGGATNHWTFIKRTIPLNPPADQISDIQFSGTTVVLNIPIPSVAGETD
jgi:hypothetical protein